MTFIYSTNCIRCSFFNSKTIEKKWKNKVKRSVNENESEFTQPVFVQIVHISTRIYKIKFWPWNSTTHIFWTQFLFTVTNMHWSWESKWNLYSAIRRCDNIVKFKQLSVFCIWNRSSCLTIKGQCMSVHVCVRVCQLYKAHILHNHVLTKITKTHTLYKVLSRTWPEK